MQAIKTKMKYTLFVWALGIYTLSAVPVLGETAAFTYDSLNRLTTATYGSGQIAYGYDSAGNLTQVTSATSCSGTLYRDADGDGYGDPNVSIQTCPQPGYVTDNTDCNDDPATGFYEHPGQFWYPDTDGDGYYYGTPNTVSCTRPAGYYAAEELTTVAVQDNAPAVSNPDQADTDGDGIGNVADAFPDNPNYYQDSDGDGIADEWELSHFGNLTAADATSDADNDTLSDKDEFTIGSDPNVSINQKWDVNGDGKIGIQEAIQALQISSGLRSE